ncbi:hypothetical protein GGQ79_004663 [Ochrobactrum pecoris]|uniref:Uncharacterized protein n=1 Tax=Brucella pecoris TaxID=867683 RepID=A0AB34Z0I2_9HYPH|nr:hypothetical protein [Brucella pecoris]
MTHADSPWSVCLVAPNGEFIMAVRHQVQNLQRRGNIWDAILVRVTLLSASNNLIIDKQATWPASSIFCFMKLQKTREVY